jgi:hypothetical protein
MFHGEQENRPSVKKCSYCDFSTVWSYYLLGEHMRRVHPEAVQEDEVVNRVTAAEAAGVSRIDFLINEMVSRQADLGPAELNRLDNIRDLRRRLLADESGAESSSVARPKRKRKATKQPVTAGQRKSPRLGELVEERQVEERPVGERQVEGPELGVVELARGLIDELINLAAYGGKDTVEMCNICNQRYRRGGNMARHKLQMHTAGAGPVACTKQQYCIKTFQTKWDMQVHRQGCKFVCVRCGKSEERGDRVMGHHRLCGRD